MLYECRKNEAFVRSSCVSWSVHAGCRAGCSRPIRLHHVKVVRGRRSRKSYVIGPHKWHTSCQGPHAPIASVQKICVIDVNDTGTCAVEGIQTWNPSHLGFSPVYRQSNPNNKAPWNPWSGHAARTCKLPPPAPASFPGPHWATLRIRPAWRVDT